MSTSYDSGMDSGWYTKNADGQIVGISIQDQIDEAVAAGRPIYVVGTDDPASPGDPWPSGWIDMGATDECTPVCFRRDQ